ncbi:MAG: hypothetical protein JNK82_18465 [Myxococcaceae bacterium]|nr:hypothetical protein [Myxococcaceae bacterium]
MLVTVLCALLADVPFSLKPSGPPGRYEIQLYADARARGVLTLSPAPPGVDGARAEVAFSADDEGAKWLLETLAKQAPRGAPVARTRLGGRWKGTDLVELETFSLGVDLKKSEGWFVLPSGSNVVRVLEQALKPWPKLPAAVAKPDWPTKLAGPGVRVVWAGRGGILFVEPGGTHKLWDPAKSAARALGKRNGVAPLAACGGGVCAVAEPEVTVLPREAVKLPARTTSLWVSQDGRWVGGELDTGAEGQHLWAWDRTKKRLVRWEGPDDLAHQLRFKAWGSKGIVFARTAGCTDHEEPGADETTCLLELEPAARLLSLGASRTRIGEATSPDGKLRVSTVGGSTVLESLATGTRQVLSTPLMEQPVWLNDRVALVGTDPLTTVEATGAVRPVLEDRLQFAGGQLDGAIVWYETTDGLYVARIVGQ